MNGSYKMLAVCAVGIICGCKPKMQEGEVFVLLKSDEVKPLADVEVIGFSSEFGGRLSVWQEKWNREFQNPAALVEKNEQWRNKLEYFDKQIQLKLTNTNALAQQAKSSLETSIRSSESELVSLSNRMAQAQEELKVNEPVYREWLSTTQPYERKVNDLEARASALKGELEKVESETLTKLNETIVSEKLPVKKLEKSESTLISGEWNIFATEFHPSASSTSERSLLNEDSYKIEAQERSDVAGYFILTFLENVPRQLENSPGCTSILHDGFVRWKKLKRELDNLEGYDNNWNYKVAPSAMHASRGLSSHYVPGEIENAKNELLRALTPLENRGAREAVERYKVTSSWLRQQPHQIQSIQDRIRWLRGSEAFRSAIDRFKQHLLEEVEAMRGNRAALFSEAQKELISVHTTECVADFYNFLKANAIYSTRTGSRGDFQLPTTIVYVFAGAVRPTGETPCWLLRIDPKQKSIRLSNSNLAAKDGSDETWMLKCQP